MSRGMFDQPVDCRHRCGCFASCPKTQTNSRLARRAVSMVIVPWRAPDLGRVGGDVRRFGFPVRAGKTPSSNGMSRSQGGDLDPGLGKDGHQGGPGLHLDQNVLGQLRRGSLGLDSGLSDGLFSAAGRPCQRPTTSFGANVALENRD